MNSAAGLDLPDLGCDKRVARSILGIARAAKQTGNTAKAHDAYGKLVTLASADADRPELAEPKPFWRINRVEHVEISHPRIAGPILSGAHPSTTG